MSTLPAAVVEAIEAYKAGATKIDIAWGEGAWQQEADRCCIYRCTGTAQILTAAAYRRHK